MDRLPDPAAVEQTKRRGRSRLFELVFQNTAAHAERSGDLFAGHRLTHVCGEKLFQAREKNIPLKDSPERIRQNLLRKSGQELPEKGFGKVPERNPAEDLFFRSPEDNLPEEFHRKTLLPEREDAEGRIEFRTADRQLPGKGVGIFKAEAERGETELPAAEILVQVAALDEEKVPGRNPQERSVQTSPVESLQRQHDLRFGVPVAADGIGAPCHNGKIENMEFQRKGVFRRRSSEECRFAKIFVGHGVLR